MLPWGTCDSKVPKEPLQVAEFNWASPKESLEDKKLTDDKDKKRIAGTKVYSGAIAVNEEDPERDRATQV